MKKIIIGMLGCVAVAGVTVYFARKMSNDSVVENFPSNEDKKKAKQETDFQTPDLQQNYEAHKCEIAQTIVERHKEVAQDMKLMNDSIAEETENSNERKDAINDMLAELEKMNEED